MIAERAKQRHFAGQPISDQTLRELRLQPEQIEKLVMQEPNTRKYANPSSGILSPLIDSSYVQMHNKKVKQLEQRVDQYVKSHKEMSPLKGASTSPRELSPQHERGLYQSDSGILRLCDGDTVRKQGGALIARQVELENMKARQVKAKQEVSDKNINLRQEKKMNEMLEKIHKEHFDVEQWQKKMKAQQARENIQESIRNRQLIDTEMAENLLKREAQINKLYTPTKQKNLNIHESPAKAIGQKHLNDMHQTPDK